VSLARVVGIVAIVAPALHSASDLVEWRQQGFSAAQLWLNYVAFLPMPWLLVGIYAIARPRPRRLALAGAILYGLAFVYFAHTTLYALAERVPSYEALWQKLGSAYTINGALMVLGGLLFAGEVARTRALPRSAVLLFAGGLVLNVALWLLPVPGIAQVIGSAVRNLGLAAMGAAILAKSPRHAVTTPS